MDERFLGTDRLISLLLGGLNKQLDEAERAELEKWLAESADNANLYQELQHPEMLCDLLREQQNFDVEQALEKIKRHQRRLHNPSIWKYASYVAACILLIGVAVYLWPVHEQEVQNIYTTADIHPGGNRAVLTLSGGAKVELNSSRSGIIVGENLQYEDGSDVLVDGRQQLAGEEEAEMSIATPRGGTYQIMLEDGTKVWLNANSKLTYPVRFEKGERIVKLEGEAYFVVSKVRGEGSGRGKPFKVVTSGQIVEVLGTSFNVSAYDNEAVSKITLVEGKVQIDPNSQGQQGGPYILHPGQQASFQPAGTIIRDVDVNTFIGWKDGKFVFEGKSFAEIMLEVERWYDIEVKYIGGIPAKRFYGDAKRSNNLLVLLRLLESAELKYKIEGRKLIIINNAQYKEGSWK